jgi:hypothetical protein
MRGLGWLVLVAAGACSEKVAEPEPVQGPGDIGIAEVHRPEAKKTEVVLEVASSDADLALGRFATSFVLDAFDDLLVRARFVGGAPPEGELALEIHAPNGGLLSIYRRAAADGEVVFVVPVGGTEISKRTLTGVFGFFVTSKGKLLAQTPVEIVAPPGEP